MQDLAGQTLGQYRIIEQIGQGGMATVYKAYQPSLDRYVAIKILPPYFAHEPGFSARFTREAKAVAKLNHPNILPIYDFGQERELSFIVMKYVATGTLRGILGEPLPLEATVDVVRQMAAALDHAHRRGILHRDVKPSNVLLDEGHWVLLTDFGLAKMVEGSAVLTASGVGVGTPAYMSPEQGRGEQVDARTDIYALGVMLYEMATGRVPFQAETPMAVVIKHITDPLPLPRSINPDLPESVERVILKALAKDRDDRFASATEMADVLCAALSSIPETVCEETEVAPAVPPPTPPAQPSAAPPAAPPAAPEAAPPAPALRAQVPTPARKKVPWWVIGPIAGVLLLAVVAIVIASLGWLGGARGTPTAAVLPPGTSTDEVIARTTASSTGAPTRTAAPPTETPTRAPTRRPTNTLRPPPSPSTRVPPTATYTRVPAAATFTRVLSTATRKPTDTPQPPTPTATVALPGREVIPLADLAPRIPWLPHDENKRPYTIYYGFDLTRPPFDDLRVRRAFALAVDRQAVADLVKSEFDDRALPATTFTPPDVLGRYLYGDVGFLFDPDQARRLLAEAGYPEGQGFSQVSLLLIARPVDIAVAETVIAMWRELLGVEVPLEIADNWDGYMERLRSDVPHLFRMGWVGEENDPTLCVAEFATGGRLSPLGHFSNAPFDRLIEQAAAAADNPPRRQVLYIQAERILCEQEAAIIPLYHGVSGQ